jgi:hypothetical protein
MTEKKENDYIFNILFNLHDIMGEQFEKYKNNDDEEIKNTLMVYCKYLMGTLRFIMLYDELKTHHNNYNNDIKKIKIDEVYRLYDVLKKLSFEVIEKGEILKTYDYLKLCNNLKEHNKILDIFKRDIDSNFKLNFNLLSDSNDVFIFEVSIR